MANLKRMDQALSTAPSVKAAIQLPFVKELVVKNYQSITGRKDGDNYFASQVFDFLSIAAEKPEWKDVDRFSIMGAMVKTASYGFSFQDGFVDLIKYGKVIKASLNYKGHREQLRQMPTIESVSEAILVLKGETFEWDKANNHVIKHLAGDEESNLKIDNIRYAYVRIKFKDKTQVDVVVTNEELRKAKDKSKMKGEGSVWELWCGEMSKKVAVHRAHKNYYRRPEVNVELALGDFAKDDDEDTTLDVAHVEEPPKEVEQVKEEPTPVATSTTPRVVGSKDSLSEFLSDKK